MNKHLFLFLLSSTMILSLASCGASEKTFIVTWKDYNDTVLTTSEVKKGETPVYPGETLTRDDDPAYEYSFSGWTPELVPATCDAIYQAVYNKGDLKKYPITWVDGDGETLKTEEVAYGETPAYTGTTPNKSASVSSTYTFSNSWSPEISSVTGPATYTAQFSENVRKYTVTYKNEDGSKTLGSVQVPYNTAASDSGIVTSKESEYPYQYIFADWVTAPNGTVSQDLSNIVGDMTVYASYNKSTISNEGMTYTYQSSTSTYDLTTYAGTDTKVVVPATYDDGTNGEHPVTIIGENAFAAKTSITDIYIFDNVVELKSRSFSGNSALTSIHLPSTLKIVRSYCFEFCTALSEITIPSSVTYLENYVFSNCKKITSFSFSENVATIGDGNFEGCTSLTSITVDANNPKFKSVDGILYSYDSTALYCYPANKSGTSFTIPSTVTTLRQSCFNSSQNLTNITIPSTITSVGNYVCSNCLALKSAVYTPTCPYLSQNFFQGCKALTSVDFGKSNLLTAIYGYSFSGCSSLSSITFPDSLMSVGMMAFNQCTSLTSIAFPTGFTTISGLAFYLCSSLTSLHITKNINSIGGNAFLNCSSMATITVDADNTSFATENGILFNHAKTEIIFSAMKSTVTNLVLPNTLTSINNSALFSLANLTTLIIPSSVLTIANNGVYNCQKLTAIYCYATSFPNNWDGRWTTTFKDILYLYKETAPAAGTTQKYWHMVDTTPTVW